MDSIDRGSVDNPQWEAWRQAANLAACLAAMRRQTASPILQSRLADRQREAEHRRRQIAYALATSN